MYQQFGSKIKSFHKQAKAKNAKNIVTEASAIQQLSKTMFSTKMYK
jgi:hypothetical protein